MKLRLVRSRWHVDRRTTRPRVRRIHGRDSAGPTAPSSPAENDRFYASNTRPAASTSTPTCEFATAALAHAARGGARPRMPGAFHARADGAARSRERARELVRPHATPATCVAIATATNEFITRSIASAFGDASDRGASSSAMRRAQLSPAHPRGVPALPRGQSSTRVEHGLAGRGRHGLGDFEQRQRSTATRPTTCRCCERGSEPVATNPSPALEAIASRAAAGVSCSFCMIETIRRQAARQLGRSPARGCAAASGSRCRAAYTASTRRWSTSAR